MVKACQAAGKCDFPVQNQRPEKGAYGYAAEISTGKDTPSGHWEMMGVPVLFDWGYFKDRDNTFPQALIDNINQVTGFDGFLGNPCLGYRYYSQIR